MCSFSCIFNRDITPLLSHNAIFHKRLITDGVVEPITYPFTSYTKAPAAPPANDAFLSVEPILIILFSFGGQFLPGGCYGIESGNAIE